MELLDKTRKIEKLLHNNSTGKVVFNDICTVMSEILASDVLVLSRKGKVLGVAEKPASVIKPIKEMMKDRIGDFIDADLNERLLTILSTNENVMLATLGFDQEDSEHNAIISPIEIAGERLGTVFIYNQNASYDIDDIISGGKQKDHDCQIRDQYAQLYGNSGDSAHLRGDGWQERGDPRCK